MKSITSLSSLLFVAAAVSAQSQSPAWGQCGGKGWSGPTACVSGYYCKVTNEFYSQCVPGSDPNPSPNPSGSPTSSGVSGPSPTLQPGYSFIRAVVDPNFHKYLRSQVQWTASDAVLGEPSTAAQFQIVDGQLIQNANGTPLYAVPASSSTDGKKLAVAWSTTKSTNGAFSWSGDTLIWSSSTISRPQNNAWLVCVENGNRRLYINLGAYGYQTPSGCNDHTIHAYTGSYPNA